MANSSKLPGLNYTSDLTVEDFERLEEIYEGELLQRLRLIFGSSLESGVGILNKYGIVSATDPRLETNAFLMPKKDATNEFLYTISPGLAVTSVGQIMAITSQSLSVTVPSDVAGVNFVLLLDYQLEDLDRRLSDEGHFIPARRELMSDSLLVKLVPEHVYAAYSQDSLKRKVVLGVISVGQNSDGSKFTTLTTRNTSFIYNRPWFSPVDYEHRNHLGTGVVTTTNPHGNVIEDFDAGAVPLFQQIATDGLIVAKDYQYKNTPGTRYVQSIQFADITGLSNKVQLDRVPVVLGPLVDKDGQVWPYEFLQNENVLLISVKPPSSVFAAPAGSDPGGIKMHYTVVDSLEPTLDLGGGSLVVHAPGAWETVISDGRVVRNMEEQSLSASDLGPMPEPFEVYCDGLGNVVRTPTTLLCSSRLGTSEVPTNAPIAIPTSKIPARNFLVRVILFDPIATVKAKVTVTGKDSAGNDLVEEIDNVGFNHAYTPPVEDPEASLLNYLDVPPEFSRTKQLLAEAKKLAPLYLTKNAFSVVDSITVTPPADSGFTANTSVTVLAFLDTRGMALSGSAVFNPSTGISLHHQSKREIAHSLTGYRKNTPTLKHALEDCIIKWYQDHLPNQVIETALFLMEDFSSPELSNFLKTTQANKSNEKSYYQSIPINVVDRLSSPLTNGSLYLLVPGVKRDVKCRINFYGWNATTQLMESIRNDGFVIDDVINGAPKQIVQIGLNCPAHLQPAYFLLSFSGPSIPGFAALITGNPNVL